MRRKCEGLKINVYEIKNDFFGESITVAGLIVGRDLINQLKDKDLGDYLIISASMVKGTYPEKVDGVFLDDVTYEEAKNELKTDIKLAYNDGAQFAKIILGVE